MMLFRLLSWPYLRRHLFRWTLTVAGIVLGVAVFVAMHIANRSVHEAFADTVDRIAGSTQLQVTNGEFGFDENVLEKVQAVPEVGIAVPVIEATVETGLKDQGSLLILGVDMTGDRSLRQYEMDNPDDASIDDPLVFLAQPDSLMVTKEFAVRNGYHVNGRIPLFTIDGEKQFTIRGIMNSEGLTQAFGGNLAVMDIYAAQAVFGRGRRFDRIDLRVRDGISIEECQRALESSLGPGFEIAPPGSRSQHFEALMKGYSMATTISSLFALIVGMFIIYNSFEIAVTHRRSEIGILRALGATQSQVRRVFLLESAAAGLIGSLIGAGLGVVIAFAVSGYMGQLTEQTAGVAQRVDHLAVDPTLIVLAILAGLATSILAAWIPARNAAAVDPVKALQKGTYQTIPAGENRRRRIWGFTLFAVSFGTLFFSSWASWKPAFYAGYILMVVSALLFAPALTLLLSRAIRPILRWLLPAEGTLAADSLIQTPRRTSATVAALMLSLAMVMGFGGVTDSIHESLTEWMNTALNPDFFVSPSANLTARSSTFPSEIGTLIESVPGIEMVQLVRNARVPINGTPVMLISIETEKLKQKVFRVPIAGNIEDMDRRTAEGKGLIVSDGFQSLQKVRLGDLVRLPSPSGILVLPIVGIIRDYSDMQGSIFIDRKIYQKWWGDNTVNIARVYVKKGENVAAVKQRVQSALEGRKRLLVLSNEEVRAYVFRLTSQWFSMTYNQIVVAVLVAVLGIVNTLTVSITDRRRELGVMQAVGGLRNQIRRTVWIEAVSIGFIGLILGVGLGVLNVYYSLGMVRRDLGGLDLDYTFPTSIVLWMIPIILGAAFLASLGPAEAAVRGTLVEALEYE
jgi:putative ABC transport system permease protein